MVNRGKRSVLIKPLQTLSESAIAKHNQWQQKMLF